MAFLTLALRDPINRYANAILGVVAAAMWALDLVEHSSKGLEVGALLTVLLIGASLLIVWHAWKWPKPAEQEMRDRRPVTGPDQRAPRPV
jgi:membrane protease YdiL (CAAX protease family)